MDDSLFGHRGRYLRGRVRRGVDDDARRARAGGRTLPAGLLGALRSLADTIDACDAYIQARHRAGVEVPTGLVMAQTQATRELRESAVMVMGPHDALDPLDQALADFAAAAARDNA